MLVEGVGDLHRRVVLSDTESGPHHRLRHDRDDEEDAPSQAYVSAVPSVPLVSMMDAPTRVGHRPNLPWVQAKSPVSSRRPAQGALAGTSLVQCGHRVAASARSPDWQNGHVFVGSGSPNTVVPRLLM